MTAQQQDPTLPRPDVVRALHRLPRLYVVAKASLPKGAAPHRSGGGRWEPSIPINGGVHDLIEAAEWKTLQLAGRFRLVLGEVQPWGRMYEGCPFCGAWSLMHNAERGLIRCTNPGCATPDGKPPVWRGRAGWLELAALLAAADVAINQGESA